MKGTDDGRRCRALHVNLTDAEYGMLVRSANEQGCSLSETARQALFGRLPHPQSDGKENFTEKEQLTKYCMQKITICGFVAAGVESFAARNGNEMASFPVDCTNELNRTRYDVYVRKSSSPEGIAMGCQVMVVGDLKIREVKDKNGASRQSFSVYADNVILGREG